MKLGIRVQYESCSFKIKQVMAIFVCQGKANSQLQNFSWNPEISLNFWDFALIFFLWPLNVTLSKCSMAIWGLKWLIPRFPRLQSHFMSGYDPKPFIVATTQPNLIWPSSYFLIIVLISLHYNCCPCQDSFCSFYIIPPAMHQFVKISLTVGLVMTLQMVVVR